MPPTDEACLSDGDSTVPGANIETPEHWSTIRDIAEEVARPIEEVSAVYQWELRKMAAHASVTEFLPVLVMKRLRTFYRERIHAVRDGDRCAELIRHLG